MTRILHILDHSIPLHSGYTFRTLSLLREQRKLGWETAHLTSPKHVGAKASEEDVDGWHFYRTADAQPALRLPGFNEMAPHTRRFATYEGFDAHANAVSGLRLEAMKTN